MTELSTDVSTRWPTPEWAMREAKIYGLVAALCGALFLAAAAVTFYPFWTLSIVAALAVGGAAPVLLHAAMATVNGLVETRIKRDFARLERELEDLERELKRLAENSDRAKAENAALRAELESFRKSRGRIYPGFGSAGARNWARAALSRAPR